MSILVAHHGHLLGEIIATALRVYGYDVIGPITSDAVTQLIEKNEYNLIVLDAAMKEPRRIAQLRDQPVMLVINESQLGDLRKPAQTDGPIAGWYDDTTPVLETPIAILDLIAAVDMYRQRIDSRIPSPQ